MPESLQTLIRNILARILSLWVKPDVLPTDPATLIDGSVPTVYVLEVGGIADRTALRIICRQNGLPLPTDELVFGNAREHTSVVVLQRRKGTVFRKHRNVMSEPLARLVEAGCETEAGELQVVPVSVYWGRAPDKQSSFWGLWFTENWQFAGRTRKLLTTLLHGRHTLLSISEPLSFTTLKSSGESAEILQRKLARILRVHFRKRRIASLGPDQSHRRMLVDHVLADASVKQAIRAEADGKSEERAKRKAAAYAYEIAADVSYPTIRLLHGLLTRLWNELYDGVELSGVDRLKRVADGHELVYVPCHRSHIDYLLLSYILYVQGFSLPHIAAGVNLNLPVVGGLLRRGGAFFLRRTFAGKPLYAAVFNAYLKEILQRGHALEYFVEGGRSRTGRLLPPKGGMLAMTVHAYLREAKTPVMFIPVYFGYERLLEGRAFTSELAGGKKQRETIFALLKSLRTLREDYGHVYVNFGTPIALDSLLDTHQPQWRSLTVLEQRPDWMKPVVDDLGNSIMRNINEAASVTPISLLATALLATPMGCLARQELLQQIDIYQRLLKAAHADTTVVVPDIDPEALIEHGIRLKFIEIDTDELGQIIQLKPGQAAPLTYFRNNILHLLTLPALIAAAFTNRRSKTDQELRTLINLTFPFLQGELFLATDVTQQQIEQALSGLKDAGLLISEGDRWRRAPAGSLEAVSLMRLAQVVIPALERDYLCAALLARAPEGGVPSSHLARLCELCAARLARTHGRNPLDLYDKHLHKAFVAKLEESAYISRTEQLLSANESLLNVESEARTLISEQVRHAIINTALASGDASGISSVD